MLHNLPELLLRYKKGDGENIPSLSQLGGRNQTKACYKNMKNKGHPLMYFTKELLPTKLQRLKPVYCCLHVEWKHNHHVSIPLSYGRLAVMCLTLGMRMVA